MIRSSNLVSEMNEVIMFCVNWIWWKRDCGLGV